MKLDKRYVTDVDLRARTTTGDPEGDVARGARAAVARRARAALDGLRGEVELPIPAASAVKIGGERAYRLHRQGVVVEMPTRRDAGPRARARRVRGRRRTPRPPRRVGDVRPLDRGRARRPLRHAAADGDRPVPRRRGRRGAGRAARGGAPAAGGERDEDRARAVPARAPAARRRDRHVRRRPPRAPLGAPGGDRLRARADGDHARPASAHRARQPGRSHHDARAAPRAPRRGGRRGHARRGVHARVHAPVAGRVHRDVPHVDRGGGGRRRGGLPVRAPARRARSRRSSRPGSRCCR